MLEQYVKITNNLDNQEEISKNKQKKLDLMLEIKKHIEKYKSTNNISEIKEIIELYTTDLESVLNKLRELQFRVYNIHSDGNERRLVKDEYSILDFQIDKINI